MLLKENDRRVATSHCIDELAVMVKSPYIKGHISK